MAFYESVFIIRPDVSSADVDKIVNDFTNIIQNLSGKVIKTEYWGLRTLAYEINNNKKAHYVLLGIESSTELLKEIERKSKLSEDILRFMPVRVEAISSEPSAILKSDSGPEELINVTIDKSEL